MKSFIIDIYRLLPLYLCHILESIMSAKYISKLWYISGGWKYESCIIRCIVMCCHYYNIRMVWYGIQHKYAHPLNGYKVELNSLSPFVYTVTNLVTQLSQKCSIGSIVFTPVYQEQGTAP